MGEVEDSDWDISGISVSVTLTGGLGLGAGVTINIATGGEVEGSLGMGFAVSSDILGDDDSDKLEMSSGDYDTLSSTGAGPDWHSDAATDAHECYHWVTDFMETCVDTYWPGTEASVECLKVSKASYPTATAARAALASQVALKLLDFKEDVMDDWADIVTNDEPGFGSGGYGAGATELATDIAAIDTYKTSKGW